MSKRSITRVDGARPGRQIVAARWQFLLLIEIANFAMLRRHVGVPRARTLAADVVKALARTDCDLDAHVRGQDLIEVRLTGTERPVLNELVLNCLAEFSVPRPFDGECHMIELNVGAAAVECKICDDVQLVEEAEQALIDSRSERRPVIRDVGKAVIGLDRIALARDLPLAIERDEFLLHYQPKLNVRSHEIASVEALIRWVHPQRGLVMPNDFIPVAEETREIARMTLWTIRRAIADQFVLRANGLSLRIFINIAGVLLADTGFVRAACGLVQGSGATLGFEITETSVIRDPQSAIAHLNVFSGIGIVIAIDDYGAGLSSLAYLKQLPAKELKIDKLFVTHLTSSHRDPLIIRSTIDLAHALEMEVVAEGVEGHAALALLAVMGCDMVQGYLIGRPMMLSDLIGFLKRGVRELSLDARTAQSWIGSRKRA